MTIALDDDDVALQDVARDFVMKRALRQQARAALDGAAAGQPAFWSEIGRMGWLGLHLPESVGGSGAGLLQTAVVAAELARAVAPGPFLATVAASAIMSDSAGIAADRLTGLADGSLCAAVGLDTDIVVRDGEVRGLAEAVLGGETADVLVLVAGADVVTVDAKAPGVTVTAAANLDPTQPCARVELRVDGHHCQLIRDRGDRLRAIVQALSAAEAAGAAAACLDMAVEYAKVREQFGRPIGSFQAVKHHCADMVVATELCAALAWDAARALDAPDYDEAALACSAAAAQALPLSLQAAQTNIQVHGGIGFTWEHDAHLFLRRAAALLAFVGDRAAAAQVSRLRSKGVRWRADVALPPTVDEVRAEAATLTETLRGRHPEEQRRTLIASGFALPQLPKPWGRALGAAEQVAVAQELDGLSQPDYGVGAWVIPTIIQHASEGQLRRWVQPSLELDLVWCQMFSEPGAGSDAAAISTRGTRVDGGWQVTGQKVWVSRATNCNRGLATIRTSTEGRKQAGITTVIVDLLAPGVVVRPLREATGEFGFGEVFLDGYFVPDEDVLGAVGDGWSVARSTLGNERVTVGSTQKFGGGVVDLVALHESVRDSPGAAAEIGRLLAESQALDLLATRTAYRAVWGLEPGREGAITKLVRAGNTQRSAELALRLAGSAAVYLDGRAGGYALSVVKSRMTSIGGGTSEIVRNLIAERLLGLPRERSLT